MTVAFAAATAMTLNAQVPQNPAPPAPQTPAAQAPTAPAPRPSIAQEAQKAAATANQSITITGCLKEGKDVAGLKSTDDLILTDVKMSPSSSVSGIGVATRYEIEGVAEAELKKHVGHQVEVTGQAVPGAAPAADEAAAFKATAVKMVAATCSAK